MIPTFILEEHHEAFIVWNYAINKKFIADRNNTLFHVDEHSDMETPRFNKSILDLEGMEAIKEFTYKELNIASFVMPACYNGFFDKVYWIRQKHRKLRIKPVKMSIRSYNQTGRRLMSSTIKDIEKLPLDNDRKIFDYYLYEERHIPIGLDVVLDIDLDYFSCSGDPNVLKEIYIEITQAEFESFVRDKYHRLNYLGPKIDSLINEGKYYYIINNYNDIYPSNSKVNDEIIKNRIDKFLSNLIHQRINPIMISICRSRFSGYTPDDQWQLIEEYLLGRLNATFKLDIIDWENQGS